MSALIRSVKDSNKNIVSKTERILRGRKLKSMRREPEEKMKIHTKQKSNEPNQVNSFQFISLRILDSATKIQNSFFIEKATSSYRRFNSKLEVAISEERGDVPGWVLVVLMTTGLVTAIWAVAAPRLSSILRNSLDSMNNVR